MTRLLPAASHVALAPASLDEDAPTWRRRHCGPCVQTEAREEEAETVAPPLPVAPRSRRRRRRSNNQPGEPPPPRKPGGNAAAAPAPWRPRGSCCALGTTTSRVPPRACCALGGRHRLASAVAAGGGRRCSTLVVALRSQPPSSPRRAEQDTAAQVAPPSLFAVHHLPLQAQQGRSGPSCSPRESTAASLALLSDSLFGSIARQGHRSWHLFGSEGDEMSGREKSHLSHTEGSKRVDERNPNSLWAPCSSAARREIPISSTE
ncbi:hypothetical protein PVAP13_8KG147200 [Panicum virgatum]|uniref:Uncharacterized protein n=1 Tax=Panicum virgatum TaxID=38727 RepID=A0A8T0PQE2_PANVG|nr:hypothetical protein PVAP13_8KG147200 [Panicum virgatum]